MFLDGCHVGKFLLCQVSCDTDSQSFHSVIRYTILQSHIHLKTQPPNSTSHLHLSLLAPNSLWSWPDNHAGLHLIQTNYFGFIWSNAGSETTLCCQHSTGKVGLTDCSHFVSNAFLHGCRLQTLTSCDVLQTDQSLKHQFPQIILVPSQKHLPTSFFNAGVCK